MPNFKDPVTMKDKGLVKRVIRLPMENFRKAVTAPTEVTKDGAAGFLFDADGELLTIQFCVPADWDGVSDMNLVLHCLLNAAETANDLIDWETSVKSIADHGNILTAGTQAPGVNHDIGALNADGDFHKVPIVLDYDDATCPIAHGDNVSITLSRTADVGTAGYVAGAIVIDICIEYQVNKLG